MSSIKCKSCGLNNFSTLAECRRCGNSLIEVKKRKERRPSRFSIWSLLPIVVVLAIVYYFYSGVTGEMEEIEAKDAKRVAAQPKTGSNEQGLSRTKQDKQRSGHYGEAVKNSPSLNAHDQRTRDTEKAIQQVSKGK